MEVYLDNSATTKPTSAVLAAMNRVLSEVYGNPSSLHRKGIEAEKALKSSRRHVAGAIGALDSEIVFTSGGTEANNLALLGSAESIRRFGNLVVTTEIEHPSVGNVFKTLEKRGFEVVLLNVDSTGMIDIEAFKRVLERDPVLVSVMMVNNEIGAIQPVAEIGHLLAKKNRKPLFHVDAVQALGKLNVNVNEIKADLLSVSGHKIGGPKGVGALYDRKGVRLTPLVYGGGQETGLRPGTENLPGIVGMETAVAEVIPGLSESRQKLNRLKNHLREGIRQTIENVRFNSLDGDGYTPHILNVSFRGARGEVLVHALEQDGIFVSTGAACSSKKQLYSHVLEAMGLEKPDLESAIRFSFSPHNTESEIDYLLERLKFRLMELRRFTK